MNSIEPIHRQDIRNLAPLVQENRRLEPNPVLVKTTHFQFTFDEQNQDSRLNVAANGTLRGTMTNDKSGVVDLRRIKGDATSNNALVNIFDTEYSRFLSNRPLHYATLIGTGGQPYEFPSPLIIHPTQTLLVDVTDLSGAPNTVRMALEGHKYYFDSEELLFKRTSVASQISRPYWYTTETDVQLAVGAGITTAFLTVVNEADFYWNMTTSNQTGPFLVRITNRAVGRMFTNGWIHSNILGGTNIFNQRFEPMLLQRRTQLMFEFQNLHVAQNDIRLTLAGTHYYYER